MAAPQYGRVFLRSHGDCFIHATPYFVKYWNFSLTQEGLGIVKVTIVQPKERVFLSCISPTPLSYDNVQMGVHHRQYLEMDPRFAEELDIKSDTEVVLESVRNIEKCSKLKLAPKDPKDFDILSSNCDKITFELTERIRVVSCQNFFNFPVWINTSIVPVKIISSEPSANWVLIYPNITVVDLCCGTDLDREVSATSNTTTRTTISSPDLSGEDEPSSFRETAAYVNYCPNKSRSLSTNSAESSVDTEYVGTNEWWPQAILKMGKKFFNFQNQVPSELQEESGNVEAEEEDDMSVLPAIRKESIRYMYNGNCDDLHLTSQGQCMNDNLCTRSMNLTPEPRPSISSESEESLKLSHKRTATWHSEMEFSSSRHGNSRGRSLPSSSMVQNSKLSAYVHTPKMDANLRVQPHAIMGLRNSYGTLTADKDLWCLENVFDVYVHPSTLPEVYHHLQLVTTGGSFLVELIPIRQTNKYVPKSTETPVKWDSLSDLSDQNGAKDVESKPESSLASSLVVRMCFATEVVVEESYMYGRVSDIRPARTKGEARLRMAGRTPIELEVPVKVGHVVMSDLVRQQLEIAQCSRIRLLHVEDRWKMSFLDGIKIVIHPINYNKRENLKLLKESFHEWVLGVSSVSKFGVILVNRQLLPLRLDKDYVNCWLSVETGNLMQKHNYRTSYCLLKPRDFERHRITVMMDPFFRSGARRPYRRHQHNTKSIGDSRQDEGTVPDDGIKLMEMRLLNQLPIKVHREDFGALDSLLDEALVHLRTVFTGRRRCGTLLVCGNVACGKSSLLKLIAREAMASPYHAYVSLTDCTSLRSQTCQRTKKRLVSLFSEAIQNQPSLLLLDDLDHVMPLVSDPQEQVREEGINSINKTQIFKDLLYTSRKIGAQMLIIASAQNQHQLNKELLTSQGSQTFDKIVEIKPPSLSDREEIIQALLHSIKMPHKDSEIKIVASKTEGFQAGDLVTMVDRAISHSELRILCPTNMNPFSNIKNILCRPISVDSGSDFDSSFELSSPPQTTNYAATSLDCGLPQTASSNIISSRRHIKKKKKKISIVSASTLTPNSPTSSRSFERFRPVPLDPPLERNPMVKTVSLSQVDLTLQDFESALKGFVPLSLRGLPLHSSGTMDFSKIGGMESIKQTLKETLQWPIKYPELFRQCPIKQRCGVLLYGPPGTGKTLIAGAVAKEFGINFISIKGPELLSKYIGASEKAVRDIFTRAQSARPCILFFDEFDSLAPKRGHDNTGVTDRVVNQLLTQLDGVEVLEGVYIVAASSRPDLIDPALLRPGRIDVKLFCSMPDESERYEILKTLSKGVMTCQEVNLREIAKPRYTDNFTGADLKALLFNTQLKAVHAALDKMRSSTKMDSISSSSPSLIFPLSPESSPESSAKKGPSNSGVMTFTYHSSFKAKRHSVVPEDIKEKVEVLLGVERSTIASTNSDRFEERQSRVSRGPREVLLTQDNLLSAIQNTRPSVSEEERSKYSRIYDKFMGKAEPTPLQDLKALVTLA